MSQILEQAKLFFDACETGKGWDTCKAYCNTDATFSSQTGALAEITTLEGYTDWMQGLFTPIPDGKYELKGIAVDEGRNCVLAYGIFRGTQTGPGGPIDPTGNSIEADYVYSMEFDGNSIKHMTKIWNDTISLEQLGWT